jgi:formate dehydrogenase subunit delta
MLHEEEHRADPRQKIVRMANQIGTFFNSKPHDEGVAGVAEHINKFWEPRMRRHFFEMMEMPDNGFLPIVREAAAKVRRPAEPVSPGEAAQANAGAPGGKGVAMGESKSEIAASQG